MKESPLFTINLKDTLHGVIMAALGGAFAVVVNSVNEGKFEFSLTALWHGALIGAIPYLTKKFFTPAQPVV